MSYLIKDLNFGLENEKNTIDILKNYFNSDIKFCKKTNFVFDFYDDNAYYELKTRRNDFSKYPTTMVSYNKILYSKNLINKKIYYIFKFNDGLYYYLFNNDDMENGIISTGRGGRKDRGFYEMKQYCYIKIENLIKI